MSEWITVKERLPAEDEEVLISAEEDGERTAFVAFWRQDAKWWDNCYTGWVKEHLNVTHWMPLPEPPEGTRNEV